MSNVKTLTILIFVFGVCICSLNAAAWHKAPAKKNVCRDGKCVDYCDLDDLFLQPGETLLTDQCSEVACRSDFSSYGYSCGVAVADGCRLTPDYSKKYPDCCNQICLDENKVVED